MLNQKYRIEIIEKIEAKEMDEAQSAADSQAGKPEPENATAAPKVSKATARLRLRTSQAENPAGRKDSLPVRHKNQIKEQRTSAGGVSDEPDSIR